jgi:hypothetical protein
MEEDSMDMTDRPVDAGVSAAERPDDSRSALSQELDPLFRYLVERAHEAVDRVAERAAPTLAQLGEALLARVEGAAAASGDQDEFESHPPKSLLSAALVGDRSYGGHRPGRARGLTQQSLGLVREHPVAVLAVAVAAGYLLRQIRAR